MTKDYDDYDYESHPAAINYYKRILWEGILISFASFVLAAAIHQGYRFFSVNDKKIKEQIIPKLREENSGRLEKEAAIYLSYNS